ncbi:MAG: c-type cytochrome domain-containing protein [Bacteroidota bacterium]
MKLSSIFKQLVAFLLIAAGIIACRHEILPPYGGATVSETCSSDSVYFVNDIQPLLNSNCAMSGCHDNASHKDGVRMTDYANIMEEVKAGNAPDSKLYKVIIRTDNERMPPPPMNPFTTAQKALIQKWINQGAKNNMCLSRCDTNTFTYAGSVKPLLDSKCVGCHAPGNLGGGVDLSTYTATRVTALNGKLYGSINHSAGYSPMPKNSVKLSTCEIRQVQRWIQAGSLNN